MAKPNPKYNQNFWMLKAPMPLKAKLDEIRINRIKNGKDRKMVSYSRLGLAISRHKKLFEDLNEADLFEGLIYAQGLIFNIMHDVGVKNEVNAGNPGYANMTYAADLTFGTLNNSIQALKMVSLVFILRWFVCTLIASALVRLNPLWFFAYILINILAIILAVPISNAYEKLLQSNIYDGGLLSFTASNFILLHLPMFVLALGTFGVILL